MEFKKLHGVNLKEVGDAGSGLAVFSTLNVVDKDGDVTLPGAFGEQVAKVVPAHDWSHVPLGKTKIYEAANEALAAFTLNLDIESARDWHSALKFDLANPPALQEWSYGFDVLEEAFGEHESAPGRRVRILKKLKVYEVSPVLLGAGEMTRTLAMKSVKGRKLSEQILAVHGELVDLLARVKDLKAKRAEDGREISAERRAELEKVKHGLEVLGSMGVELAPLLETGDPEARKLYSQFILNGGKR